MISLPPNAAYLLQVTYSTKSHSQGPSLSTRSVKPFSTDSTLPTSLASSFTPHKLWPCWITYSPITVLHVLTNPWLCTHCILYTLFSAQNIPFLYLFLARVTLISKSQLRDSFWGGFNKLFDIAHLFFTGLPWCLVYIYTSTGSGLPYRAVSGSVLLSLAHNRSLYSLLRLP